MGRWPDSPAGAARSRSDVGHGEPFGSSGMGEAVMQQDWRGARSRGQQPVGLGRRSRWYGWRITCRTGLSYARGPTETWCDDRPGRTGHRSGAGGLRRRTIGANRSLPPGKNTTGGTLRLANGFSEEFSVTRPQRADARRNRELLLEAASAAFEERGADASPRGHRPLGRCRDRNALPALPHPGRADGRGLPAQRRRAVRRR